MNNQTAIKNDIKTKPLCRIVGCSEESCNMLKAVLSDILQFSNEGDIDITVTDASNAFVLSGSRQDSAITVERPATAEYLRSAAASVLQSSGGRYFAADPSTRSAIFGASSIQLTETEFKLYSAILENRDRYTSAEELSLAVWGQTNRNLCTVYISYLRRKLNCAFGDGTLVCSRGKGYRLRDMNI